MKFLIYEFNLPYLLKGLKHPFGGAAVETLALIKGLIYNGCQVGVLTWKGAKDFINRKQEFDIIEAFDREIGIRKIRWIYYRYPALIKSIKYYSPDCLLQKTAAIETGILAHIAKNLNIPLIYKISSDTEVDKRLNQTMPFYEKKIFLYGLKNAEYIITQNEYQDKKLKEKYHNKKIFLIHNAFYPFGKITELKERRYIAWVGTFREPKNLSALINIVGELPKIEFKIAGTGPTKGMDKNTQKAVVVLSEYKNVQFVGYLNRKEIMNFLANAYALLNTSNYEGFSNAFLEAFVAGTPVISLNSDPSGILKKYKLGFEVNHRNLANVIKELINDCDFEAYKVRMRDYLNSFHDYKIVSRKLIDILKRY